MSPTASTEPLVTAPLITVVIPTYNGGDWLLEALASCLEHQQLSLELIVVDDASSDDTPQRVVDRFAQVRLIRQPCNSGSGAHGRNTGLQLAKGRYVKFLDHDDLLEPGSLALEVEAAEASGADLVMSRWGDVQVDSSGALIESSRRVFIPPDPDQLIEAILRRQKLPYTAGVLYRRSYIKDQRWDPRLTINDDFDWFCRNALRGGQVIRLEHVSYYWRLHDRSLQGRQKFNPMALVESVYIENHVYGVAMDTLLQRGLLNPSRATLLADRLYHGLRCLARFNWVSCLETVERIQLLVPGYCPSAAAEARPAIRRFIRYLGLTVWLRFYATAYRPKDWLRPLGGQLNFFTPVSKG